MPRHPCLLPLMAFALGLSACDAGGDAKHPNPAATTTEAAATTNPENPEDEASPAMNADEPDAAACGADKLARWLNVLPTETVKADIRETVGHDRIRYIAPGDTCGASKVAAFVSQKATPAVRARVAAEVGHDRIRWVGPDTVVTMDFRPDRLNVTLDENDVITGGNCS